MTVTYTDDAQWTTGDVALLSTDGVRLRVPLKLQAASAKLRQAPPQALLRVPAPADTLRAFLDLAASRTYTFNPAAWADTLPVIRLLVWFNAPSLLDVVFDAIRTSLTPTFSLGAFVLAAAADNPALARDVIKEGLDRRWGWQGGGAPGRPVLDPAGWPAYMHTVCPGEWAYALARAWLLTRDCETKDEGELLGATFERVLARARSPPAGAVGGTDTRWTGGEWEIVSADGVRFHVPSYLLLSLSPVFRDMVDVGSGPPTLELVDPELESAAVLRLLLHFLSEGTLAPGDTTPHAVTYTLEGVHALVLFLRKWSATPALNHVLLLVERGAARGQCCALRAFMVAAAVEDATLVSTLVAKTEAFFPASERGETAGAVGRTVWDPAGWPLSMWALCPPRYAAAAARAWGETRGSSSRAHEFPRAFRRWLQV